nr:hypothetical protein [Massilia sp. Se16.2.3]
MKPLVDDAAGGVQLAGDAADHQRLAGFQRDVAHAARLLGHFQRHLASQFVDCQVARVDQARGRRADGVRLRDARVQRGDLVDVGIGRVDDGAALLADRLQLGVEDVVQAIEALGQQARGGKHLLAQRGRGGVVAGNRVERGEETVDRHRQAGAIVAHHALELGQVRLGLRKLAGLGIRAPHLLAFITIGKTDQRADLHTIAHGLAAGIGTHGRQHRRLAGVALGLQVGDVLARCRQRQLRSQRARQRVVHDGHGGGLSGESGVYL